MFRPKVLQLIYSFLKYDEIKEGKFMPSASASGNIFSSFVAFKKTERVKKSEGVQQSLDLDL
jgi:hypothetical protein